MLLKMKPTFQSPHENPPPYVLHEYALGGSTNSNGSQNPLVLHPTNNIWNGNIGGTQEQKQDPYSKVFTGYETVGCFKIGSRCTADAALKMSVWKCDLGSFDQSTVQRWGFVNIVMTFRIHKRNIYWRAEQLQALLHAERRITLNRILQKQREMWEGFILMTMMSSDWLMGIR